MIPALTFVGVEWTRPLGLASLALPVLVLLVARVPARPPELATGTLAVWRSVGAERPTRARGRPRMPPFVRLVALALFAGGLALGGPRLARPSPVRVWQVVVDASPSMSLPLDPDDPASPTRARAARAALERWARELPAGDELRELVRARPVWSELDRPGTLWLTDRTPEYAPRHAGFAASGGAQVPGAVATRGTTRIDWDGTRLVERPGVARPAAVRCVGGVPRPLVDVLAAWATAHGLVLFEEDPTPGAHEVLLRLVAPPAGAGKEPAEVERFEAVECDLGRDGWRVQGLVARKPGWLAAADGSQAGGEPWLRHEDVPVVESEPGRIRTRWIELGEPRGDPAAFAVSWARLFDATVLDPEGVVAVAERRAAGEPSFRAPASGPTSVEVPRAPPLDAWLAGLAAVLALAALSFLLPGESRRASESALRGAPARRLPRPSGGAP